MLGADDASNQQGMALTEETESAGRWAEQSLQQERLAQVRQLGESGVDDIIAGIRRSVTMPKLDYHFAKHGEEFGAATSAEYLEELRRHLQRDDLRIFTYLRGRNRQPFWELADLESGTTLIYNERERRVWSFYRMANPRIRLARFVADWIEVVRTPTGWRFVEQWHL